MRKTYIQPILWSHTLFTNCNICQDSPTVTGDTPEGGDGPGYGGVDEEGEIDPGVKPVNEWETGLW